MFLLLLAQETESKKLKDFIQKIEKTALKMDKILPESVTFTEALDFITRASKTVFSGKKLPISGPHCGPGGIKALAHAIPDKFIYGKTIVSFEESCKQHDMCYHHKELPRAECDRLFHISLKGECYSKLNDAAYDDCIKTAETYYSAVDIFGEVLYGV